MTGDALERGRAVRETDRSFAVEASAGTGKTMTLISRILHLVLEKGPAGEPLSVSRLCAITFTEKAAGEMKLRLRQELEKAVHSGSEKAELAGAALRELENAAISTFHSFAVSLLKERPIEAGLDPRFTALDDLQGNLFFMKVWEPWINRALIGRRTPLADALREGISLDQVRNLADTLRQHEHMIRRLSLEPPPSNEQIDGERAALLKESSLYSGLLRDPSDLLVPPLQQAIAWLQNPSDFEDPTGPGKGGKVASWKDGKDTVEQVRDFIRRVVQLASLRSQLPRQRTLAALARWLIDEFLAEWDAKKRAAGYLDFDDQLAAARQLLVSSPAARSEFQNRYATLLVDEFQDTDPVQLEIVLLLASTDPIDSGPEPDLTRLRPQPGRLFIVGDPKQSIYRFRGADIESYLETMDAPKIQDLHLESLALTTNFRSVPSILRFVDAAFDGVMKREGYYQSKYLPFGNRGARSGEPGSPSVHVLGDRCSDGILGGAGKDFTRIEAIRIARLVLNMVRSEDWLVQDRPHDGGAWRKPGYGDIAILLPVLSRVDALERELRDAGIPYVLEGGKFYYARSEVASAISVLRAVANPNDQVALYSALRSIFFGMSDEDLLRARLDGIPLDYRSPVPAGSSLHHPYAILRSLHGLRHERPASETLEVLLQRTGAREVLAARGLQSLANLGKLVRQLRTLQEDTTFSEVVSLLGTIDEEEMAESESRLLEERSQAVRILTIHKAKGLDFHIAIIAGAGLERGQHSVDFLADTHEKKRFAFKLGSLKDGWRTPGWDELREGEKKREDAELLRLLYVAFTRASDHLVVSTHNKGNVDKKTGLSRASLGKTRLAPLSIFLEEGLLKSGNLVRFLDTAALDSEIGKPHTTVQPDRSEWGTILRREYEELERLISRTPRSHLFQAPSLAGEGAPGGDQEADTARSRAVRLGVAFHEAMESIDFGDMAGIPFGATRAGTKHRLSGEAIRVLQNMMGTCLQSRLIERVRKAVEAGGGLWRELPYLRPLRPDQPVSGTEEGKIDLIFEEGDGWVLVDYKTDSIPDDRTGHEKFFQNKYASQIRQYVEAIALLGITVKEACLLLARTGEEIKIPLNRY